MIPTALETDSLLPMLRSQAEMEVRLFQEIEDKEILNGM